MDTQTLEYFNHLISQYGYLILILFTFLEGETIVIIAGVFVHSGTLSFPFVVISSFTGAFLGDQLYFFLGRKYGKQILYKKRSIAKKTKKITKIIEKNESLLIISFRFLYGLRTVTPLALGVSKVKYIKFIMLNFIGAVVWAYAFSYLGFMIAKSVKNLITEVNYYQYVATLIIILFAVVIFIFYRSSNNRKKNKD